MLSKNDKRQKQMAKDFTKWNYERKNIFGWNPRYNPKYGDHMDNIYLSGRTYPLNMREA